jgi:Tol biopolymer transport system component
VINIDGSGLVQLTQNDGYDGRPRWSPDGTQIAFETDRDGDWDVFLMKADGSDAHPLTVNAKASDWMQDWSPDGEWLVYVSSLDGNDELYLIRKNGTDQRRLTEDTYDNFAPVWIP